MSKEGGQPVPDGRQALRALADATAEAVRVHGLEEALGHFRLGLVGLAAAIEALRGDAGRPIQRAALAISRLLGEGPIHDIAREADAAARAAGRRQPPEEPR